jgi:2-polyprenyl-3-methyl-5-hydroxy-6-metoxy-1,4-benzoquinol methylase
VPVGSAGALIGARRDRGSPLRHAFRVAYAHLYGCSDLHTHIRWRAIRRAIVPLSPKDLPGRIVVDRPPTLLDVGCGDGIITLEVARRFPQMIVRGIELEPDGVVIAERTRTGLGLENVSFFVGDVNTFDFDRADAALLLDVIEHLPVESGLIERLAKVLKVGGTLVISTPTPNYPRFFGREFHEAVGHVRDGYSPDNVERLLEPAGFVITGSKYYTRLPSSLVCALYYRYLWRGKLGMLLSPLLNVVSWLDILWPSRVGASSILVTAKKCRAD